MSGLLGYAETALLLSLVVTLPILAVGALVGLVVAVVQAASQVQDQTLSHLPRVIAVAVALLVMGPWMGQQIAAFSSRVFYEAAVGVR